MAETHLILPVPVAEPLVGAHRARFDPVARAGVPAHITVLGPFAAQDTLTSRDLDALDELFGVTPPIVFRLARVARFAHALYLEPEPAEPFVALTEAVWRRWPLGNAASLLAWIPLIEIPVALHKPSCGRTLQNAWDRP